MSKTLKKLRKYRTTSKVLRCGKTPLLEKKDNSFYTAFRVLFYGGLIGLVILVFGKSDLNLALVGAAWGGLVAVLSYCLWPALNGLLEGVRTRQWPAASFFQKFQTGQKLLCVLALSWGLVYLGNHSVAAFIHFIENPSASLTNKPQISHHTKHLHHEHHQRNSPAALSSENANLPLKTDLAWSIAWLTTAVLLTVLFLNILNRAERRSRKQFLVSSAHAFRLWLGHSSGSLSELAHGSGLAPGQKIALSLEDAAQNILILGGIGSGKTTRAMHPFLMQLLDQQCGGLIFDIKGDFKKAVALFAEHTQRTITIIGPNFEKMNLLAGLSPEMAASFLKSVFLLNGKAHSDAFWMDTATELCRNTLGLLAFLPARYSLQGLYCYLFDWENKLAIDQELEALLPTLNEKTTRLLNTYWQYQERVFDKFDEKVKTGVNATIAQVLSPFNHPELVEAFCSMSSDHVPMEAVLDGAVYLVDLPLSVWGLGGKVAYSLIKLRFYNVMQQRALQSTWDQDRPVFFMCDEFQEIVSANKDGLSDLNFWDKSRSSKTIGIISAQAISSFYASIGDRDIAHALLQNFRQKICFRTEDTHTLAYFNQLIDKVDVIRTTYSNTTGTQSHPGKLFNTSSSSFTENSTLVEKSVLSPQLFRSLKPDQAIALLSVAGHSMDDVIQMMPVFV